MANYRWNCPTEEHPGVNAPARMHQDNILRYCIPCSLAAGKLIRRVSPVLERRRAEALDRRKLAGAQRQKRTKSDGIKLETTADGLDIRLEISRLKSLPCWAKWGAKGIISRLNFRVRGGKHRRFRHGFYRETDKLVLVNAGGMSGREVTLTFVHEMVHAAHIAGGMHLRPGRSARYHDGTFHHMLLEACEDAFCLAPEEVLEIKQSYHDLGGPRNAYNMDRAIEKALGLRWQLLAA